MQTLRVNRALTLRSHWHNTSITINAHYALFIPTITLGPAYNEFGYKENSAATSNSPPPRPHNITFDRHQRYKSPVTTSTPDNEQVFVN